jgi:hypothetical protein
METYPHYTPNKTYQNYPYFQKFPNTPTYTTRDYLDTLIVQLSLIPFATNGTYGHDHQ